jgi:tetratricopeptide (TPR) repeat protein
VALNRWLIACVLMLATLVSAQPANPDTQVTSPALVNALTVLRGGKPQDAIAQLDGVIAHFEGKYRGLAVKPYSTDNQVETLIYMMQAATEPERKSAAVYSGNWAAAYFLKAYALLELKRPEEARASLQAAIDLAPRNVQYRNEMGAVHAAGRNLEAAMQSFKEAESMAREASAGAQRNDHLGRALRGQGFVLIEMKRLDEAAQAYRQSLEFNPGNRSAAGQLAYIESLRAGAPPVVPRMFTPVPVPTNFDEAWDSAEIQSSDPAAHAYITRWALGVETWSDGGVQRRAVMPHEKARMECITAIMPTPPVSRAVFAVNAAGVVTNAWTDQAGWIAECMQQKLPGMRLPPPALAPLYMCMRLEIQADGTTVETACGAQSRRVTCTQTGTSRRCSVSR